MKPYIALALIALAAGACNPNAALRPEERGVVTTVGPQSLPGLYIGALNDFEVAWSGAGDEANGGHEGNVGLSAIFTDELTAANLDEFTFRRNLDNRIATPANTQLAGIFNDLSASRHSSENTAADFAQFEPKDLGRAEMMSIEGYTYIIFAEMWCSGVPFGELNPTNGSPIYGMPQTTGAMDTIALTKFDSASALAAADTSNTEILALSMLGRARVLLDLGQFTAAGATADSVLAVDPALNYQLENSVNSPRQYNGIWQYVQSNNAWGVVNDKGGNGLDFISAQDPRILWVDSHQLGSLGQTASGNDTDYFQLKYPEKQSSATLASATEATLISAEVNLRAGQITQWASKLNSLRISSGLTQTFYDTTATTPTLVVDTIIQPLQAIPADSTTLASDSMRVEVHFREREFWLWLTGSRLGDLRRLLRQYNTAPWGTHYDFPLNEPGTDIRFPVPVTETNNPNFKQCQDVGHEQ
jgi:starch-binding outer membrane protein, SusD/RagB family